jgi:tetratricopeptide (TPR) repeat protein
MNRGLGAVYLMARQYERAIEELKKAIEFNPKSYFGHLWLSFAYQHKGMYKESLDVLLQLIAIIGFGDQKALIEQTYAESGYDAALLHVIPLIPDPYHKATLFAFLGEREQALEWLEKAQEERSSEIGALKVDPMLDSLRSDPRFKALLERMNLD